MKKAIAGGLCMALIVVAFAGAVDYRPIEEKATDRSRKFAEAYFPNETVSLVKIKESKFDRIYTFALSNGCRLQIDEMGRWKEIDCRTLSKSVAGVPLDMLPDKIGDWIKAEYPHQTVALAEWNKWGYELRLSDASKLRFTLQGSLIEID